MRWKYIWLCNIEFWRTTLWYVLPDVTPKGGEVDLAFSEKKNNCMWCLINLLFNDCVGAAYKQESSVNHVITWDTQIFLMLQTPIFKYKIKI